jgi:hypothetical protein
MPKAKSTHCGKGHRFDTYNTKWRVTKVTKKGKTYVYRTRECRKCGNERQRTYDYGKGDRLRIAARDRLAPLPTTFDYWAYIPPIKPRL